MRFRRRILIKTTYEIQTIQHKGIYIYIYYKNLHTKLKKKLGDRQVLKQQIKGV